MYYVSRYVSLSDRSWAEVKNKVYYSKLHITLAVNEMYRR